MYPAQHVRAASFLAICLVTLESSRLSSLGEPGGNLRAAGGLLSPWCFEAAAALDQTLPVHRARSASEGTGATLLEL